MKYKNLITSILSLVTTSFLLIGVVVAWYVSNQEVSVNTITVVTEGNKFTYALDYYDKTTEKWTGVNEYVLSDMLPGDAVYFRLSCSNTSGAEALLNGHFENITSKLDTNYVKKSGTDLLYAGVKAYTFDSENVVRVNTNVYSNAVLYTYDQSTNKVGLGAIKIEDSFRVEYFGQTETKTGAITDVDTESEERRVITGNIFESERISEGVSYLYFALMYLDDDDRNNFYMYQELFIASLVIGID